MKLLFGDIHDHCGISYGYGSLENALKNALSHLDFVAVTGHAFWPDIPPVTPDTEFLVSFHKKGFEKLKGNYEGNKEIFEKYHDCWDEYVSLAEAAIFEYAFRLGARLAMKIQKDTDT